MALIMSNVCTGYSRLMCCMLPPVFIARVPGGAAMLIESAVRGDRMKVNECNQPVALGRGWE